MKKTQGKVVRILSPTEVVVNLGSNDGVSPLSSFVIYVLGDEILDPDTQESLGHLEIVRGTGNAKHIQDKMTTIQSAERTKEAREHKRPVTPPPQISIFGGKQYETIVEEVEVPAPFEGVQVGDLVRVL